MFFNSLTVSLTAPTVVIIRYRNPRFNKIFGSYFSVFVKCGVTPHCLYRGSITLRSFFSLISWEYIFSGQQAHVLKSAGVSIFIKSYHFYFYCNPYYGICVNFVWLVDFVFGCFSTVTVSENSETEYLLHFFASFEVNIFRNCRAMEFRFFFQNARNFN